MTIKCEAGAPARYATENGRKRSFAGAEMVSTMVRAWSIVFATLREIFDESAYQRFLERKHIRSSPAAYSMFQCENNQAKARRPRCC